MKRMKRLVMILLSLTMVIAMSQIALAETQSKSGGTFTYNGSEIVNDTLVPDVDGELHNLQPGDSMEFRFDYRNASDKTTEWYLSNEVLETLEAASEDAKNGGYTYTLTNYGEVGTVEIFNSDRVGGTDSPEGAGTGLEQATGATDEWFNIDRVSPKGTGYTILKVTLDGESQANGYENTYGSLNIAYAVEEIEDEVIEEHVKKTVYRNVKTGDNTNIILPVVALVASLLLLILAVISFRKDRKDGDKA